MCILATHTFVLVLLAMKLQHNFNGKSNCLVTDNMVFFFFCIIFFRDDYWSTNEPNNGGGGGGGGSTQQDCGGIKIKNNQEQETPVFDYGCGNQIPFFCEYGNVCFLFVILRKAK